MQMQAQKAHAASASKLLSEDKFDVMQHNIHCQTEANSRNAKKYKIWTAPSGRQFSKCPNNPDHDELLEWKPFASTGGHKGQRFTCPKCKSDNATSSKVDSVCTHAHSYPENLLASHVRTIIPIILRHNHLPASTPHINQKNIQNSGAVRER